MVVTVDRAGLLAQYADPEGGASEGCRLLLPARRSELAAITDAVERANEELAAELSADSVSGGRPPAFVPRGLVVLVAAESEEELDVWVSTFAEQLAERGWHGVIEPFVPPPSIAVDRLQGHGVAAVLALAGAVDESTGRVVVPWQRDEGLAIGLTALAGDWLSKEGALRLTGAVTSQPEEPELPEALFDVLRDGADYRRTCEVSRTGAAESRQVAFDRTGHVVVSVVGQAAPVDHVQSLIELCTRHQIPVDWTVVMECRALSSGFIELYKHSGREPGLPRYYMNHRERDREYLPDAFLWQAVTETHLGRLTTLGPGWTVESVGRGLWSVRHDEPSRWLRTESDRVRPDASLLAQAREQFGALLLPGDRR
jgi:hypothetical protein